MAVPAVPAVPAAVEVPAAAAVPAAAVAEAAEAVSDHDERTIAYCERHHRL